MIGLAEKAWGVVGFAGDYGLGELSRGNGLVDPEPVVGFQVGLGVML